MNIFKKLFGKSKSKVGDKGKVATKAPMVPEKKNGLDKSMEEIKKDRERYVSLGRSIFPVIKAEDDQRILLTKGTKNEIIYDSIAPGIVKCYVLDMGDRFEMLSKTHLTEFNLDKETIDNTAIRNLIDKVNERCGVSVQDFSEALPESKPFYKLEMDANYPPSVMLLDDFWDTTAKEITKSDTIAVSIPAKNLLFFSDMKLMESFRTMRPVSNQMYDASLEDNIHLTKNTYIRKDGKWILFKDTAEQLAELW